MYISSLCYMRMKIVIIFSLLILGVHVSAFNSCPKCGTLEVPYPLSTKDNCGNSRYKVYCNNDTLHFMSVEGFYYEILSINLAASKLVIRPSLMQKGTCYSSDFSSEGLKIDENSPFNISTHNTVMLFNCSDGLLHSPLNCSSNSFCTQFEEKMEEGSGCQGTLCCHYLKDSSMTSHMIRVRVGGCTAYTSVVDMQPEDPVDKWNYGVELQWLPPN